MSEERGRFFRVISFFLNDGRDIYLYVFWGEIDWVCLDYIILWVFIIEERIV